MEVQIIYDSNHGHTKSVVSLFDYITYNVSEQPQIDADIVMFFCPTYGDEELPHGMEKFLMSLTVEDKFYVVCELGNYYGYDDFEFGAKKIIEYYLTSLNWKKFHKGLSLDSFPKMDTDALYDWKRGFENVLQSVSE